MQFRELDIVRVVALRQRSRAVSGTEGVLRDPRVGDIAAIVHLHPHRDGAPDAAIVECVDAQGRTIWLADFELEELTLANA